MLRKLYWERDSLKHKFDSKHYEKGYKNSWHNKKETILLLDFSIVVNNYVNFRDLFAVLFTVLFIVTNQLILKILKWNRQNKIELFVYKKIYKEISKYYF